MIDFFTKSKRLINNILEIVAIFLLTIMSLLVIYQVIARYIFNNPSEVTQELIRYFLIWTGFIGAAYGFVTREHMSLIYFRSKISPDKQRYLLIFVDTLVFIFSLLVMVIGGTQLMFSVSGVHSALIGVPRSLVYAMGPVSGIFILFIQIINIWEDITNNFVTLKDKTDESQIEPSLNEDPVVEEQSQSRKDEMN